MEVFALVPFIAWESACDLNSGKVSKPCAGCSTYLSLSLLCTTEYTDLFSKAELCVPFQIPCRVCAIKALLPRRFCSSLSVCSFALNRDVSLFFSLNENDLFSRSHVILHLSPEEKKNYLSKITYLWFLFECLHNSQMCTKNFYFLLLGPHYWCKSSLLEEASVRSGVPWALNLLFHCC